MPNIVHPTPNLNAPNSHHTSSNIAVVEDFPPALLQKNIGSKFEAKVLNSSTSGSLEVQTNLGKLLLSTALNAYKGEKLLLQLLKLSPQPNFLIRRDIHTETNEKSLDPIDKSILKSKQINKLMDSKPVSTSNNQSNLRTSQSWMDPQDTFQALSKDQSTQLIAGDSFNASILKFVIAQGNKPNLPLSRDVGGKSLETFDLTNLKTNKDTQNSKKTLTTGERTSRSGNPPVADGSVASISVGSKIELRILGPVTNTLSGDKSSHTQSMAAGQVLRGHVISITNTGQPLIETLLGYFVLSVSTMTKKDSIISIEFISNLGTSIPQIPDTINVNSLFANRNWPTLNEALKQLQNWDFGANRLNAATPIPKVDNQMATKILFFLSALRGGDIRNWFGNEATRRLQASRPELFARLSEEFIQMARSFNELSTNDWRTTLIPLLNGSQFDYLQMHFKGKSNNPNREKDGDVARFIVDLDLSKLGRIQLDGLITSKGKQLDLFVRSEKPFTKIMRHDLNKIFSEFTEITGIIGNLVIQSALPFVNIPCAYTTPNRKEDLIV